MGKAFTDSSRGIVSVTGDDAGEFLQGLLSNDINKAKQDAWLYALILTAQGKIIADIFIQAVEAGYLLDCPRSEIPTLMAKLKIYKLRSKVNIEAAPAWHLLLSEDVGLSDPRHPELWRRTLVMEEVVSEDEDDYHQIRMKLLIPDFAMDLWSEKFYPHELGMNNLNAIDYKKGCYVGQEVTARVEYRGVVRKKLHLVQSSVAKGEAIVKEEREIGLMLGSLNGMGLALLRDDPEIVRMA